MAIPSEVTDLLADCSVDLELLAKTFFRERFWRPFSPLHREMFSLLNDPTEQKVVIAGPRSVGKSSLTQLLMPMQAILFSVLNDRDSHHYIVPIQFSGKNCMLQTESIKDQLETNEMILKFFGNLKSGNWSKELWETSNGVQVLPRGMGQQIRGLLYRDYRPSLLLPDDIENKLLVQTPENRQKTQTWYFSDVEGCVDRGSKLWRIVHTGNITHQDCLVNRLLNKSDYTGLRLELCDDNYKSNWPEYLNDAACRALAESFREKNAMIEFFMDYRCIPLDLENQEFKGEFLKRYSENDLPWEERAEIENIILVDPAKKWNCANGDDTAIGCVGLDAKHNRLYLRDLEYGQMPQDTMYDKIFEMQARWRAAVVGVEVTSLHDFIVYPIKNEMMKRGSYFTLVELKPFGGVNQRGKNDRIKSLVPLFRQGVWYLNETIAPPVESQLLAFPRGTKDDIIDMMAYITPMLSEGGRYFSKIQLGVQEGMVEALQALYGERAEELYEQVLSRSYND